MDVDCLAVGILVADHLCTPIPHVPAAGELVRAEGLELCVGGCAANTALDLARLGVRVGVVGCVGDDPFGRFVVDELAQRGVEISGILRRDAVATAGTLILNVTGEDRRFVHAFGANATLRASDVPPERVRRARVLYVGGYQAMPALTAAELGALFRTARAAGVATVLDLVISAGDSPAAAVFDVLPHTDVFLPNRDEAEVLTGLADPVAQGERFLAAGAGTAVITCGESGAVLVDHERRVRAHAHDVEFVGGTGAGDAFSAGYVAGMLAGENPVGCLRRGSALGASCVRALGATEGVFTRDEADRFLRDHPLQIEPL